MELTYKCDCCKEEFVSRRVRTGEKLCGNCVEIRRALKGFLNRGLSSEEILKRAKKLIAVKVEPTVVPEELVPAEV